MRQPLHLMDDHALAQRRAELLAARHRIDLELRRVTVALVEREPARRPIVHGAAGYRRGCKCAKCRAGKAAEKRLERANRAARANQREQP